MNKYKIGLFSVMKNIGSAYNKPQNELKNYLKSSKNKILIVSDPTRLSRNLTNFKEIFDTCVRNNHKIAIVSHNSIYDCRIKSNYQILVEFIRLAEKESKDIGDRVRRTYEYKKSRELPWGKTRDSRDVIISCDKENKISYLIKLLATEGSNISEIRTLINSLKTKTSEPFEIIEYSGKEEKVLICETLPYPMKAKNICDTLNVYGITYRNRKWYAKDVVSVLINFRKLNYNNEIIDPETGLPMTKSKMRKLATKADDDVDNLCNDFNDVLTTTTTSDKKNEWICVYYNPSI